MDMGFNREPRGTLNSMTAGGQELSIGTTPVVVRGDIGCVRSEYPYGAKPWPSGC